MNSPATVASRRRNVFFGLPLLGKELIEQATRPRTYIIRSVYALLLLAFSVLLFWAEYYANASSAFDLLGRGGDFFQILMWLQVIGVLLFAPALTCGAITAEKERNTFGLLMLTKLGPSTILLEKYLGRLVTMGTFLLLSVPLFGFCYAFGGLETADLVIGMLSLAVTVAQISAIGVCCSAFCRTTVSAFIATYVVGFVLILAPLLCHDLFRANPLSPITDGFLFLATGPWWVIASVVDSLLYLTGMQTQTEPFGSVDLWGIGEQDRASILFAPAASGGMSNFAFGVPFAQRLACCVPALMSAAFFILLARLFIIRRAFVPASNLLLRLFKSLDKLFYRLNENRVTKGIVLIDDSAELPEDEPIAWRETKKKSLGTVRYLIRVLVLLEFPTCAVCLMSIVYNTSTYSTYWNRHPAIIAMNALAWIAAILFLSVKSATLISSERSHETLDVLLSTPMHSEDLIREKTRGANRLMFVVGVPLVTTVVLQAWYGTTTAGLFGNQSTSSFDRVAGMAIFLFALFVWMIVVAAIIFLLRRVAFRDRLWTTTIVVLSTLLLCWLMSTAHWSTDFNGSEWRRLESVPVVYFILGLCSVATYLPLISWVCFYIGLRMKTQTRAIFASLALLVAWCVLPIFLFVVTWQIFGPSGSPGDSYFGVLLLTSPLTYPFFLEAAGLHEVVGRSFWTMALLNFSIYLGVTLWIRHRAIKSAPLLLGRLHTDPAPQGWSRTINDNEVILASGRES